MWTSRPNDNGLNTYETHVRVNNIPTKVQVQARSTYDAQNLLEGQYGRDNVMGMPIQIK